MLTIAQVATPSQIVEARGLIREFTNWAKSLTAENDQAPAFDDLEAELADLPGKFAPPTGCLLLATHDGQPAGCVAFWAVDGGTVEIKRMYVRPACRGNKIGAHLVAALIAEARARQVGRIVLDTYFTMTAAHAIYRAAGFRTVAAPPDFPLEWESRVVFMQLDLA